VRHIHTRLAPAEQRKVSRLHNRIIFVYAALLVAIVALTTFRTSPDGGNPVGEAHAKGAPAAAGLTQSLAKR